MTLPPAECVSGFQQEAQRLGVEIRWQALEMHQLHAAYHARPGAPGLLILNSSGAIPDPQQLCTLLAHEMVHVLQHWKGKLQATPPLGWPDDGAPPNRKLSKQEREAYTAQRNPLMVLEKVRLLRTVRESPDQERAMHVLQHHP